MKPRIIDLPSGKIAVHTPYHPEVPKRLGRKSGLMGTWDPYDRAWILLSKHREKAQAMIDELWPPEDALIDVIATYHCGYHTECAPILDGLDLVYFGRDHVGSIRHAGVYEVVKNTLKSAGSRAHPTIAGTLIVKAKVRPGAVAKWSGFEATAELQELHDEVTARSSS